jgi:pyruvate/2-oxoglutarate dehydrogenase complex dihydrolipoamide acyltransferase (E2) component
MISKEKKEIAAAPSIRRLARELGIDIYKVEGTGPGDRITAEDVKAYSKEIARKSSDKASIGMITNFPISANMGALSANRLAVSVKGSQRICKLHGKPFPMYFNLTRQI